MSEPPSSFYKVVMPAIQGDHPPNPVALLLADKRSAETRRASTTNAKIYRNGTNATRCH